MITERRPAALGWSTVVIAAALMAATLPGRTHGLGFITESLLASFPDLDRIAYASMNCWATLLGALFCFPAGWSLDRFGIRATTAVVAVALGATTIGMTCVQSTESLGWLFMLSRGFGQSALSVASIAMLSRAFPRRSDAAAAVYTLLVGLLFGAAFKAMGAAVKSNPWTVAWSGLGWTVLLAGPLLAFAARPVQGKIDAEAADAEGGATFLEALRTGVFWAFAVGISLFGLVSSGMGLFMQSILEERGFVPPEIIDQHARAAFSAGLVADLQSKAALIGMAGQLTSGLLLRVVSYRLLFCAALLIYALAVGLLPFIDSPSRLNYYVAAVGFSGGTMTLVFFGAWKSIYGTRHVGRIVGAAQMGSVAASAVGALYFAWFKDLTGSYNVSLWLVAAGAIAVVAWGARVTIPKHEPTERADA